MRRGLMRWEEGELPRAALSARTARLQDAMARAGIDAMLLYTNLVRPSAVTWLSGFTPYWSEGLLLIGRSGEPAFATALSKRVADWIRSVSPAGEIVNTPRPGTALGKRVAAEPSVKRVGILEMDAFPAGAYDDFAAVAPGVELVDATRVFAQTRRGIDASERALLARADTIAVAALDQAEAGAIGNAGAVAARIEQHARLAGAEEIYIALAPDLAAEPRMVSPARASALRDRFAVRVSVAYKGCWVRRTRTFAKQDAIVARCDAWLADLVRAVVPGAPLHGQIAAAVHKLDGAVLKSWMAETCVGSYPLQAIAASRGAGDYAPALGDFLVLSLELTIDGAPWIGAGPAIVGAS
jgi:Xaa-Pro aminopeptidase